MSLDLFGARSGSPITWSGSSKLHIVRYGSRGEGGGGRRPSHSHAFTSFYVEETTQRTEW
jgi:hypothetical protein